MKLALGPILYYWPRSQVFEFYEQAARWPVDIVYLGEVVCAKRRDVSMIDWLGIAEALCAAGKEVVLSTLALVEAESELATMRRLVTNGRYWIEANDVAAVRMLTQAGPAPFVIGPHINAYNTQALELLAALGARRWVCPVELDRETLSALQQARPPGLQTEVFAFGRMPLAFSARCFTARAHDLGKDACAFRCLDHPDGLLVHTREGEPFLVLNGIQVQSARHHNLLGHVAELSALGVDVLRISPQRQGTADVVTHFRAVLDGAADAARAAAALAAASDTGACDGYWRGTAGMTCLDQGQI